MDDLGLLERFEENVKSLIDAEGVYPFPGMAIDRDAKFVIAAIDDPKLAFRWFWNQVANEGAIECIIGIDRITMPGQGTLFDDVLTCCHWKEGISDEWGNSFRIGVINYRYRPRVVMPIDWENEFWFELMSKEAAAFRPAMRISTA